MHNSFDIGRGSVRLGGGDRRGWGKKIAAVLTTVGLVVSGLALVSSPAMADTTPTAPGEPETVTSVPLPTAQMNGVAWAQAIAGNTVYVGGEFTAARPAGAAAGVNTSPRQNLMAYTLSTGVMTSWNPGANGAIKSIVASPDGSRVYVAGSFTSIAGASRNRVAAFSTATGALLSWNPGANAQVSDVSVFGDTVWLVGNFSSIGGGARTRVAAVSATTGALRPFTATVAGGYGIKAIVISPTGDKVVIAGSFTSTNGSTNPGRGMAALNSATGESMEWKVNSLIRNGGEKAAMLALASDGDSVYGTGYDFGGGPEDDFEGTFRANWADGEMVWLEDCHGDTYSVAVSAGVVYNASHDHYCGNIGGFPQTSPKWTFHHSLAYAKDYLGNVLTPDIYGYKSYAGQPSATLLHWFPDWQVGTYTGKSQATWDVTANDDYVVYGGEFLRINNVPQEGLVRFAKKSVAPDTDGPELSGTGFPVSALSLRAGEVRVSWAGNTDRDDKSLTYQLFRQDLGATPIYETTADSNFWTIPDLKYTDATVTPGTTYQYRVRATDPNGNAATGAWTSVTATTTAASDYSLGILDDGAVNYWPLSESSGTTGVNWADGSDLAVNAATRNVTGPNTATPSRATRFGGTSASFAAAKSSETGPNTFSVEAWFNTTSTAGGKIVGFGSSKTGSSNSYDRHVYIDGAGRITFGVYPGGVRTVASGAGFNDGAWHYVVAAMGPAGMTLSMDGVRVDSRTDTTTGQGYTGYWKVGGDNINGWPNRGASDYLDGSISDVAIYDSVLTRGQIDSHWVNAGRTSTLPAAPADAYGKSVFDLAPSLFWRLGETTGSIAADSGTDSSTGTYFGDVTKGVSGALTGVSNTAVSLNPNGGAQTGITSDKAYVNPTTFSVESWFKTDSTSGGKILGFGNARTGTSSSYDRHVFMSSDGRVKFGVWTGSAQIIESAPGYNDNAWHLVVAEMSDAGMKLYLDGALVSTSPNTQAQDYSGYWRVGGDSGWEGDTYWRGSVDEVAVYPTVLSAAQVQAHWDLGSSGVVNQPPTAAFSSLVTDLSVAFDGTASSDAEGPIASYAWDFGDGQTATEASPTHQYATAGTYDVTLTVTDATGSTNALTQSVTVAAQNLAPTAEFTAAVANSVVSFDASDSSDSDGSIASYSWSFGDGASAIGETVSHTYASVDTFTVTLTVTDNQGASASIEKPVTTIAAPNASPVAAFTSVVSGLGVSVDGSTSTDADGTIAGYAWDFGDSATATGATASHTYGAAGTYTVTLTVTDDKGATNVKTATVTVTAPPQGSDVLASDAFGRTVSNGWGTADQGGAWSVYGSGSRYSVSGGAGVFTLTSSTSMSASLPSVSSSNTQLTAEFSVDKIANAQYISMIGRQVGSDQYLLRTRVAADGSVQLYVLRNSVAVGGAYTVPGLTIVPGEKYTVSFEVTGTSPTTLNAKIWKSSDAEPAAWQLQRTDNTAALQAPGSVGVFSYVPNSANAYPVKLAFDSITITDPTIP